MPIARFISSDGPYLEALIEVDGQVLCVMDDFSPETGDLPPVGTPVALCFDSYVSDDEDWDDVFTGNPDQRQGLVRLDGWRYRAYGRIVAIQPVLVDCGLLVVDEVIHTHDPQVIGAYVAFTIQRLTARPG
ncbi:hypothetical protein GCM10007907_25220 [Chitinimonas prasina]|uniref:Uncharacterized protein n=1 Tax=Chitinimonas prasina TaxID=1434937 RepID=A0ABQ5YGW9_9NEIS|nr:hypothetical protein [Chitinimonas prasina]GLR13732.1 hypothetical protein GCM10007907_25220 [Chitinimonas prasina]